MGIGARDPLQITGTGANHQCSGVGQARPGGPRARRVRHNPGCATASTAIDPRERRTTTAAGTLALRTITMSTCRLALLCLLAAPIAAHADVYKCTVDGRTTFQQTPCDGSAPPRAAVPAPSAASAAAPAAPPPTGARTAPAPTARSTASRPQVTIAELDAGGREALARQAFTQLKAREIDRLRSLLCAETDRNYARPELRGVLDTFGKSLAAHRSEIGEVLVNEPHRVHFAMTEWDRDRASTDRKPALPFSVGLKREADGRTCVNGLGVTASGRSK